MKRAIGFFLIGLPAMFFAGCNGGSGPPPPPPPPTLDPQYVSCSSTTGVDAGNPNEPVISLIGPRVVNQPPGSVYVDAGATAADPHDGDITKGITVTGLAEVNTNAVGDYPVRYNVVDSAQLPAVEVVRMVRVSNGRFVAQTPRDIGTTSAHMPYYEHLPVHYSDDPTQTFPLLIFQHGYGNARFTADGTREQAPLSILLGGDLAGLIDKGHWDDSRPFIVLSPQRCVDPLTFVRTAYQMKYLIDYAVNTYKVDTSRIYMAGFSQGSGDTWDYVNNFPQQLAAVVPISGPYGTSVGCVLKNTPAWAFQAADDTVVAFQSSIDTVNSINACNPPERAKITLFPSGGHSADQVIYLTGMGLGMAPYDVYNQSIYDWLLAHGRLTVAPSAIEAGGSATLHWSVAGADACVASGDWLGPRPASGTESVSPNAPGSHRYTLSCHGPGGDIVQSGLLTERAVADPAGEPAAGGGNQGSERVRTQ
jgi:predicted esterase